LNILPGFGNNAKAIWKCEIQGEEGMSTFDLLRPDYLMESEEEAIRLDIKTDPAAVRRQAIWAGLKPGMRVLDVACGSGKTTAILYSLVEPSGTVIGIDSSLRRIEYAKQKYKREGIAFLCRDIRESLDDLGKFDLVWVRFVLEYYRTTAFDIVKHLSQFLKPGGIMCLIDLDHNCLNFYGLPERLEKTILKIMEKLMNDFDFDPYAGRKLYSYLYQLGFTNIEVHMEPHHLIYGNLKDEDAFNWSMKLFKIAEKINIDFSEYKGGKEEFLQEAKNFLHDPQRFIYTPLIMAKGIKHSS